MLNRPLVWLAGFFVLGIIIQYIFPLNLPVLLLGAVILIIILVVFLRKQEKSGVIFILGLALICGALRLALADSHQISSLSNLTGKRFTVQGVVSSYPEVRDDKIIFEVMVDKYKLAFKDWQPIPSEKVQFYLFKEDNPDAHVPELAYGNSITAHGKLVKPSKKRNPGEFDFRQYLRFRNIYCLFYIYEEEELAVKGWGGGSYLMSVVLGARESFSRIVHSTLAERQAVLLLAMLFGEKGAVMEEDLEIFRQTGIAHALAVSGLHVGLVLLLVLSLCRTARAGPGISLAVSISALCFYCILCAFTVTVVRATIMGIIGLLAYFFDRERNIYIALAASAIIILMWNPFYLLDPGFQLSFSAVFAIVYLEPYLRNFLPSCFAGREGLITVPLAAQLGTLPVIAWHFNMISVFAVLANMLLIPVLSAVVIIGVFAFILFFVSNFAADVFLHAAGFLLQIVVFAGDSISPLPGRVIFVASPPIPAVAFYYLLLVILKERLIGTWTVIGLFRDKTLVPGPSCEMPHGKRAPVSFENIIIILFILLMISFSPLLAEVRDLKVFFLDVGQGDAVFIRSPSGSTVLVDGGGMPGYLQQGYDPGQDTVLPFLRSRGIDRLDLIINTHPDEDHLDGLEDVLAAMPVGKVITPPVNPWWDKYADFLALAREKGVSHLELTRGAGIKLDKDVLIKVLAPGRGEEFESCNDSSLVLLVCHGNNRFLLLGDLEREGIESLLDNEKELCCTVLKIPHHGGKSSFHKGLYKKASPQVAVISVGENNTFGHPAGEVVEYWKNSGARLYRTDLNGCVIVSSDGKKCAVQTIR